VGDLLCRAVVETPVNLNAEQAELLEKFRKSLGESGDQSPRQSSWFDGVKSFFEGLN
jgi:molecular chaperone DnaJ